MTENNSDSTNLEKLETHLQRRLNNGNPYFRAKEIADDVGMTPKQIGGLIPYLKEKEDGDVTVERWSRTKSITWRIQPV